MREAWIDFYHDHASELREHYPGLGLSRFLKEMQDILRVFSGNPVLLLDHSVHSVSPLITARLEMKLLEGTPFAYLLGKCEFYNHEFYVNSQVLIPRPETELLVDHLAKGRYSKILDVGGGSGAISLSLLSLGVAQKAVCVDISEGALEVASINAARLRLKDKVQFIKSDRLQKVSEKFDLIVSNPPYIKSLAHRSLVHQGVDKHEPALALYLEDTEYENWFSEFFKQIKGALELKGTFMMEGHELELQKQAAELTSLGFSVEVLQDLSQRDRFLKAILL